METKETDIRSPRYRTVLVAVDGSPAAREAARHAATLALAHEAMVAILAVMDTGGVLAFTSAATARYAALRAEAQEAIETASGIVRGAGGRLVEHLIMDGVPAAAIIEVAGELDASVIVIGNSREPTGGIAAHLLRHAPCSILVVPA